MILKVAGIGFSYDSEETLKDVSFEVCHGEILGIIGPNGAGKSTLLKCMNKLLKPRSGTVSLDGHDLLSMSQMEIARRTGFVPQNTMNKFPVSVFDTVLMGRFPHLKRFHSESSRDFEMAHRAISSCGIAHLSDRLVTEISGGEFQKAVIARALAQEPKVLLLDEPTLHLDIGHQLELLELLRRLTFSEGLITVMVSHDLNLAMRFSDRIIVLKEGAIFKAGTATDTITAEVLKEIYGLKAEFIRTPEGRSCMVPVEILKTRKE